MARLMLRCPMTDRNFATGINTDRESLTRIPDTTSVARCPHCGQDHPWRPNDASLAESIPLSETWTTFPVSGLTLDRSATLPDI